MTTILRGVVKQMNKNGKIKWNFTKFLIDRSGEIAARFEPAFCADQPAKAVRAAYAAEKRVS